MGYACPVCEDPQADGEHLANHLAFSAMLGNADHERWLDEHAPGWADADPEKLADVVIDHADETEYPQVFEDTTESGGHDHAHDQHPAEESSGPAPEDVLQGASPGEVPDPSELYDDAADRDTDDVLAEARELTRQRRDNASETEEGTDADGDDEDDSDAAVASGGDGDEPSEDEADAASGDADDAADDAGD